MAPEFTPSIALLDTYIDDEEKLKGNITYYEKKEGRIGVQWGIEQQPEGYKAIGGGVAYIQDNPKEYPEGDKRVVAFPNDRYQWSEGRRAEGDPPPMMIMVVPKDYTVNNLVPAPIGTDIFTGISKEERLVLFWMPEDDNAKRIIVEWTIQKMQENENIAAEWMKINQEYLSKTVSPSSLVDPQGVDRQRKKGVLLDQLEQAFDEEEFRMICFRLDINYDRISGRNLPSKIVELLIYLEKRGRISDLVEICKRLRPDWEWPAY